jgi:hypothetical protein
MLGKSLLNLPRRIISTLRKLNYLMSYCIDRPSLTCFEMRLASIYIDKGALSENYFSGGRRGRYACNRLIKICKRSLSVEIPSPCFAKHSISGEQHFSKNVEKHAQNRSSSI